MRYIEKSEKNGYIGLYSLYIMVFLMLTSFLLLVIYNIEANYIRDEVNKIVAREIYKNDVGKYKTSAVRTMGNALFEESKDNEIIERNIEKALKERFEYIAAAEKNRKNMGIIALIAKTGSYDRDVKIISGKNKGTDDKETSVKVKIAVVNRDIYDTVNGEQVFVMIQKKVMVKTEIRLLYPRILLLGSVKGDQIEVSTDSGKIIKSRIYLSFADIFSLY